MLNASNCVACQMRSTQINTFASISGAIASAIFFWKLSLSVENMLKILRCAKRLPLESNNGEQHG